MLEKKVFFGAMDSDTSDRLLADGDYRDAVNLRNSIPDQAQVGSLPNIKGNLKVPVSLSGGANKTIGHYDDVLSKRTFSFNWNENGDHQILVHSTTTGTRTVLVTNSLLNFNRSYPILHIDIIDDLLLWTDNYNEPCAILISKAQTGFYNTVVSRQYFDAIAYPTKFPPVGVFVSDDNYQQNNLRGKVFQFRQTFIDEMNRECAASPISKIPIPVSEPIYLPDGNYQTFINNKIELDIQTGNDMVKKINVYVREGNTGDWYLASSLVKANLGIGNNQTYTFDFYNDEAWVPVSQSYINRLFDRVPLLSQCQSTTSDKRITYSNFVEGYDNIVPDCTIETIYSEITPIDSTVQAGNYNSTTGFTLTGTPSQSAAVNSTAFVALNLATVFTANNIDQTQVFSVEFTTSYTSTRIGFPDKTSSVTDSFTGVFPSGTSSFTIVSYFANLINSSPVLSGTNNGFVFTTTAYVVLYSGTTYGLVVATNYTNWGGSFYVPQVNSDTLSSSITSTIVTPHLKSGSHYKAGLIYSDKGGRLSTTQFIPLMDFKVNPYSTNPTQLGPIKAQISISHAPPSWAEYYQLVLTENLSKLDYIQVKTGTVSTSGSNYKIYLDTIATYNITYPNAVDFVYAFTPGDRLVLLKDSSANQISSYVDVEIVGSDTDGGGLYILVASTISIAPTTGCYVELYTPKQTISEQVFWEIGEAYPISNGFHRGNIQNQTQTLPAIVEFTGDSYFRFRGGNMGFFIESKSLSDFYSSESWNKGRPNRIDTDVRQLRRASTVYYSEAYVPETNLNGLSVIFDTSFESGDIKYGSIQRTYSEEDRIEFYYQLKTSFRLVGKSTLYAADGSPQAVQKAEAVLSQESFYEGEYGIGDNPESFAVFENERYHTDANRGVVCRLTNSGYDAISKYKMIRYFSSVFNTRVNFGAPFKIWGVFDVDHKEYVLCFEEATLEVETFVSDTVIDGETVSTEESIILGDTSVVSQEEASKGEVPPQDPSQQSASREMPSGGAARAVIVTYTLDPITIAFSKTKNRWVQRYTFFPECIGPANIGVVSYKDGELYVHDTNPVYNNFYGIQYNSEVKLIINQEPSAIKVYQDVYTESTHAWSMSASTPKGQLTSLETTDFEDIEGVFYAALLKDINTPVVDSIINGDDMRGETMEVTLTNSQTVETNLFAVNVRHVRSMLTNV